MKKTLIALAVLGMSVGAAQAQSSVTIYGSADISYVKTNGYVSEPVTMNGGGGIVERSYVNSAKDNTYLGFMGSEDLGGGLKATFQLEQHFNLANGVSSSSGDFEGAANVGLAGSFGQVRFGRVNELSTETYRRLDPFNQNGVAGALTTPLRGDDGNGRLSYTARYDSPSISGFNFGASYTVKNNGTALSDQTNNGWAVSGTYTNGPIYLVANYNKGVNVGDSYNWNVGGSYAFGPLKLSLGYEKTVAKDVDGDIGVPSWLVGASYTIGNGTINAAYSTFKYDLSSAESVTYDKYAIGYTHNLSKRTSLYANYSHFKAELRSERSDSLSFSQYELGITHKF